MTDLLTTDQAYHAMFSFLERYYELTGSDDVGALLGSMNLLADRQPADSAMWAEWCDAVKQALDRK